MSKREARQPLGALIVFVLGMVLIAGCSNQWITTAPRVARVVFDGMAADTVAGAGWWVFSLHNSGNATAYAVKVYWHFTGSTSVQVSPSQPGDLTPGEKGIALCVLLDAPAWTVPTGPDSIRWTQSKGRVFGGP